MTDKGLMNHILSKYQEKYPNSPDWDEYVEYVYDLTRKELEIENTMIPDGD